MTEDEIIEAYETHLEESDFLPLDDCEKICVQTFISFAIRNKFMEITSAKNDS